MTTPLYSADRCGSCGGRLDFAGLAIKGERVLTCLSSLTKRDERDPARSSMVPCNPRGLLVYTPYGTRERLVVTSDRIHWHPSWAEAEKNDRERKKEKRRRPTEAELVAPDYGLIALLMLRIAKLWRPIVAGKQIPVSNTVPRPGRFE